MKVLVVGTGGAVVSGITSAADQMVRTLSEMGHHVERLDAGSSRRRRPNHLNLQNLVAVVTDAIRIGTRARRSRADVVWYHTFGVPTLPALRAVLVAGASRLGGARPFVHVHAYGLEDHLRSGGQSLNVALRVLGRVAARVIVLNEDARIALVQQIGASRVAVLENWVEVPDVNPGLPPAPPLELLFVGGLIARKGVPELIDAIRELAADEIRLTLVGSAAEDGYPDDTHLRDGISDLIESGAIRFVGELAQQDVAARILKAHVLVLPSRAEGTPLVVLEAMGHGRAVVVSDAGNLRTVVEDAGCGIVLDRVSTQDLAEALRRLHADHELVTRFGKNGFEAATNRWSPGARQVQLTALLSVNRSMP